MLPKENLPRITPHPLKNFTTAYIVKTVYLSFQHVIKKIRYECNSGIKNKYTNNNTYLKE